MWIILYILVLIIAKKNLHKEGGSISTLTPPFNTACPLKIRKILLSAYELSASRTEPTQQISISNTQEPH
jgi:hypothetical protein